jgi:hypothetical protein
MLRLIFFFSRFVTRWVPIALALFMAWQLWVFCSPKPLPYTEGHKRAIREACREIERRVAAREQGALRLGVMHFSGDNQDAVTDAVREALDRHAHWQVVEGSPINKFFVDVTRAVANASSLDEIIHAGRAVQMDAIVAGRVLSVTESNQVARAQLKVWVVDTRTRQWLLNDVIEGTWRPNLLTRATWAVQAWDWRGRMALWLGFVLLLPWLTPFGTRWAIERKSNAVSFGLLTLYTLLDLLLAVALAGFIVAGGWDWTKFFGALLLCGAYNFWVCERIAVREK